MQDGILNTPEHTDVLYVGSLPVDIAVDEQEVRGDPCHVSHLKNCRRLSAGGSMGKGGMPGLSVETVF